MDILFHSNELVFPLFGIHDTFPTATFVGKQWQEWGGGCKRFTFGHVAALPRHLGATAPVTIPVSASVSAPVSAPTPTMSFPLPAVQPLPSVPSVVTTPNRDAPQVSASSSVVEVPETVHLLTVRPLLELDIKVPSGEKAKLVVYPGDVAEDVANGFSLKHSLQPEKKTKLLKVIRASLAMHVPTKTQAPG